MAAAYEAFLQRIQDGLKKEEEKKKSLDTEITKQDHVAPKTPSEPPPPSYPEVKELGDEEEEELPTIEPVSSSPPPRKESSSAQPTNLKELYEEICDQIRGYGTLDIIVHDFQEFKTDLDRVTYVSQLTELENLVLGENYAQKNHDDACNYEKVYDLLINNEASAEKALDVIKKCIQKTSPEETAALATRYMKRGWAFLLLEEFENAQSDAQKSLSYGCPGETLWNSYEILGHTHAQAKNYKQAEVHFLKALENLRKSNTANEVKASVTVRIMIVFKNIKSKKGKKSSGANQHSNKDVCKVPQISYGAHPSFPSASSALDFVVTKEKGRCTIAKRDIKPGDVVMVDSPYCSMMNPDYFSSHCYHCFNLTPVPVPCNSCAKVGYCCEECRVASWEGLHSKECTVLNHLTDPGIGKMALLVFRVLATLTWAKLQELKEKINTIVESEFKEASVPEQETSAPGFKTSAQEQESSAASIKPWGWEGSYNSDDYMTVFHLSGNSNKRSFGDLFKRAITAVYVTKCLKVSGYFNSAECSDEDELFVASVLLRHLQGSSCNAYEVSEFELGPAGVIGAQVNEIGGALYTTVSLTNHACFSNTTRYSVGDKCVLRALRSIPKGAEVFDNYGFNYYLNTYNERQEILLNQYKFKCVCDACCQMWSLYPHHPTETLIFRCPAPDCGQAVCYSNTCRAKCNMCGNQQQYARLLKELEIQLRRFKDAITKLKQGNVQLAVFCNHIEFLDRHAILPVKHYSDVQEAIKQCFNYLGNIQKPKEPIAMAEPQQRSIKLKAGKSKHVNSNTQ